MTDWIELRGDVGTLLGYVNRVTGAFSETLPTDGRVTTVFGSPRSQEIAKTERRAARRSGTETTPPTPVEKAIAAIVENVQRTGRARLALDDEEV